MTVREAIEAEIQPFTATALQIGKAIIDLGAGILDWSAEYSAADKQQVYRAAFTALRSMLAVKNVGEGGFSIGYDAKELRAKMKVIAGLSGDQNLIDEMDDTPKVRAVNVW